MKDEKINPILEVRSLSVHFFTEEGIIKAVENVNFEVYPSEIFCLVGESGCGKSVTALSILRLIPFPPGKIISGKIIFNGKEITLLNEKEMEQIRGNEISMVFQEPMTSLNPVFTIGDQIIETIELHKRLDKREAKKRSIDILTKVRIPSAEKRINYYPHQLSGGMRQRAMIAIALCCEPKILIADEPTTALDVTIQAQILSLLKDIQRDMGMSIILITHDLGVVSEIADRLAVMYSGRIVEMAPIREIFDNPRHPYTKGLLESIPKIEEEKKRLNVIPGQVPNPLDLPNGCKFNPRCFMAVEECKREEPPLIQIYDNHFSRCIRWEKC